MRACTRMEASAECLLTTEEACRYAGMSYSMLRAMHHKGEIFPRAVVGITHHYHIDDLDDLQKALGMVYNNAKHLTVEQAADYLGCHQSHVSRYVKPLAICLVNGRKRAIYKRWDLRIAKNKMKEAEQERRKSAARKKYIGWLDSERRKNIITERGHAGTISEQVIKRKSKGDYVIYRGTIYVYGVCFRNASKDRSIVEEWLIKMTKGQERHRLTVYYALRGDNKPSSHPVHIDGWLNSTEAQKFIAQSNPCAPKKCRLYSLLRAQTREGIRKMYRNGNIYVREDDLKESLREYPVYGGHSQTPRKTSLFRSPFHIYVDSLPAGGDWMTVRQAAKRSGEKVQRINALVSKYSIKSVIYNGLIHIRYSEMMKKISLRTGSFIRKHGKAPKDYPVASSYVYAGSRIFFYYAPDLIGK